jgi:hypothetical protein
LRWSATQAITEPWTAIVPRTAKRYSVALCVRKERWVSIRWKPTVIPAAVTRYMTARIARSVALTTWFQKRTIAVRVAAKGTTTAPRLASFVVRVISWVISVVMRPGYARPAHRS